MTSTSPKGEKKGLPEETEVDPGVLQIRTTDIYDEDSGLDPVYHAKATLLNEAFQEIGMGRYQVRALK